MCSHAGVHVDTSGSPTTLNVVGVAVIIRYRILIIRYRILIIDAAPVVVSITIQLVTGILIITYTNLVTHTRIVVSVIFLLI